MRQSEAPNVYEVTRSTRHLRASLVKLSMDVYQQITSIPSMGTYDNCTLGSCRVCQINPVTIFLDVLPSLASVYIVSGNFDDMS